MEEENCLIVLDSSGSMNEEGKRVAGEYLLRAMVGFIRDRFPQVHCGAYAWGESVARYEGKSACDRAKPDAGALAAFASEHQDTSMVLISDGNFSRHDCTVLSGLAGLAHIHVVVVGADANRHTLRKLVGPGRVFESAGAVECVRQLLQR